MHTMINPVQCHVVGCLNVEVAFFLLIDNGANCDAFDILGHNLF